MSQVEDCVDIINQSANNFKPQVGLILGSGLGQFCDNIETQASIDFDQLPGFPIAGVGGHAGRFRTLMYARGESFGENPHRSRWA